MGCFGSRSTREVSTNNLENNQIKSNYLKLVRPSMLVWDQEIMKPIKIPSPIIEKGKAEIIDAEELKDLDYKIF